MPFFGPITDFKKYIQNLGMISELPTDATYKKYVACPFHYSLWVPAFYLSWLSSTADAAIWLDEEELGLMEALLVEGAGAFDAGDVPRVSPCCTKPFRFFLSKSRSEMILENYVYFRLLKIHRYVNFVGIYIYFILWCSFVLALQRYATYHVCLLLSLSCFFLPWR